MRSPLRSKRAITSPVRARSKASGLTRIRVRLTAGAPLFLGRGGRLVRGGARGPLFAWGVLGRSFAGLGRRFFAPRLAFRLLALGAALAFLRAALAFLAAGEGGGREGT